MRLMLAGDTHGNLFHIKSTLYKWAIEFGCAAIVELGDFGYWEHTPKGAVFLDAVSDLVDQHAIPFFWIDGNHENHTLLRFKYDVKTAEPERITIRDGLYYLPRGFSWTWGEKKFLAMGGAYSIDKEWRRPNESWWPEEMITEEEIEIAKNAGKVDIMLTHDAPDGIDLNLHFAKQGHPFFKADPNSVRGRKNVRRVVENAQPEALFHGHFHIRYNDFLLADYGSCKVVGLGCDNMGKQSFVMIDV